MERHIGVWLCFCFVWLIMDCSCKKSSLKLLKDQLRVTKESHALDIREINEEIGSLKESLEEIRDIVNSTSVTGTDVEEKGGKVPTFLIQRIHQRIEDIEASTQNFAISFELLKKGFKSLKVWNSKGLKALDEMIVAIERQLATQRQEWLMELGIMQEKINENDNHIKMLQEHSTLLEEMYNQTAQMTQQARQTCKDDVEQIENSMAAKVDEVLTEVNKINKRKPGYSFAKAEWDLIFKSFSSRYFRFTGYSIYEHWIGNHKADGIGMRDPAIDSWDGLGVLFVRLALYDVDNKEVAFVLFDGAGSNKMNWFSKERILDSSWSQLRYDSSLNYASIPGDGHGDRRFFINVRYGGCENDHGFLIVKAHNRGSCDYERIDSPILYSRFPGGTRWSTLTYGTASHMTISIKTK